MENIPHNVCLVPLPRYHTHTHKRILNIARLHNGCDVALHLNKLAPNDKITVHGRSKITRSARRNRRRAITTKQTPGSANRANRYGISFKYVIFIFPMATTPLTAPTNLWNSSNGTSPKRWQCQRFASRAPPPHCISTRRLTATMHGSLNIRLTQSTTLLIHFTTYESEQQGLEHRFRAFNKEHVRYPQPVQK